MRHRSAFVAAAVAALVVAVGGVTVSGGVASATGPGTRAATAGCGQAPTLASGTHTIQSGGQSRSYILRVPDGYDSSHGYRLVFGFHWNGGTANDVDSGSTSGA